MTFISVAINPEWPKEMVTTVALYSTTAVVVDMNAFKQILPLLLYYITTQLYILYQNVYLAI